MRYMMLLLLFCTPVYSATIEVPKDYAKIQDAIDAAMDNDVILVDSGTYAENLFIHNKGITLKSKHGLNSTIIDGQQKDRVINFFSNKACCLEGFTITNGASQHGAGILCNGPVKIRHNRITQNMASPLSGSSIGAGIACYSKGVIIELNEISNNFPSSKGFCNGGGVWTGGASEVQILNNEIHLNRAGDGWGAGIRCQGAAVIAGNKIHHNSECERGGGISCNSDSPILVSDNQIYNNSADHCGGGVYLWGSMLTSNKWIRNCLIAGNKTNVDGGGIYSSAKIKISNCTVYGNEAKGGNGGGLWMIGQVENSIVWNNKAVLHKEIYGNVGINHSNVKGGMPGVGNIDKDPLFYDPAIMSFFLKQDPHQPGIINPCVDAGNNLALNVGLKSGATATNGAWDVGIVDMGYHYVYGFTLEGLVTEHYQLSERTGGVIDFKFDAGFENSKRNYLLLGSANGISPGVTLPGGTVLPLNWDIFTNMIIDLYNSPLCQNFMGTLDKHGMGWAHLKTGPLPNLAGTTLHFAYALSEPWDFASNPVQVDISP